MYRITNEQKQDLINRTVKILGNNPTASGYSAEEIRRCMYQAIAGATIEDTDINVVDLINSISDTLKADTTAISSKIDQSAFVNSSDKIVPKSYIDNADSLKVNTSTYNTKVASLDAKDTELNTKINTKESELITKINTAKQQAVEYTDAKIGNGTITIVQNNQIVGTFTANTNQDKVISFVNGAMALEDYIKKSETYTKTQIDEMHTALENLVNGKSQVFVAIGNGDDTNKSLFINYKTNQKYDADTKSIAVIEDLDGEYTEETFNDFVVFTDANGIEIKVKDLKSGDSIFIAETNVPDWWVYKSSSYGHQFFLYQLETQKVDLTDYATKTYVNENGGKIDKIKVNGVEQAIVDKAVDLTIQAGGLIDAINLGSASNPCAVVDKVATIPIADAETLDVLECDSMTISELKTSLGVPSKTSDLTNDSGFITASSIPSNVSAFTNDSGYLTAHQSLSEYQKTTDADSKYVSKTTAWEISSQSTGNSDGTWNYVKYTNGRCECWITQTITGSYTCSAWGSVYAFPFSFQLDFPFTITDKKEWGQITSGAFGTWTCTDSGSSYSNAKSFKYVALRPTQVTAGSSTYRFELRVIGRWQ